MQLREWMKKNRYTNVAMSKLIGCHTVSLSGYLSKRTRFSKFVAAIIEKITNGEVTAEQVLKDNKPLV